MPSRSSAVKKALAIVKQNNKAKYSPIKATQFGPYTYKGHHVDAPGV